MALMKCSVLAAKLYWAKSAVDNCIFTNYLSIPVNRSDDKLPNVSRIPF